MGKREGMISAKAKEEEIIIKINWEKGRLVSACFATNRDNVNRCIVIWTQSDLV